MLHLDACRGDEGNHCGPRSVVAPGRVRPSRHRRRVRDGTGLTAKGTWTYSSTGRLREATFRDAGKQIARPLTGRLTRTSRALRRREPPAHLCAQGLHRLAKRPPRISSPKELVRDLECGEDRSPVRLDDRAAVHDAADRLIDVCGDLTRVLRRGIAADRELLPHDRDFDGASLLAHRSLPARSCCCRRNRSWATTWFVLSVAAASRRFKSAFSCSTTASRSCQNRAVRPVAASS